MFMVSDEPTQAFVDAIRTRLKADAAMVALASGGIWDHVSGESRTSYPYIVLGRRGMTRDVGAMQVPGGRVTLHIDGWSNYLGQYEMAQILSRISILLERATLAVGGFAMVGGSLTCEMSEVFDEVDEDKPDDRLYHGVQRWTADVEEAAA